VIDDSDDCVLCDNLKENTLFYIHDPNCFSLTSFLCLDIMFKSQCHDDMIFVNIMMTLP